MEIRFALLTQGLDVVVLGVLGLMARSVALLRSLLLLHV